MDMKGKIQEKCIELEKEYGFKILFAVESGSRLWGMSSEDSDYDVHVVYFYPINRYLSLQKPEDVFTWMSGNKILDINGFDIYKYARLLIKSNPNMIDWTLSNIVYYGNKSKIAPLIDFAINHFNPFSLFQYYYRIAESAQKLINKGNKHYKKYLYILRGILNAKWLVKKQSLPPYNFEKVVNEISIENEIRNSILELLTKKRNATENSEVINDLSLIKEFIKRSFDEKEKLLRKILERKPMDIHYQIFDKVILKIIK